MLCIVERFGTHPNSSPRTATDINANSPARHTTNALIPTYNSEDETSTLGLDETSRKIEHRDEHAIGQEKTLQLSQLYPALATYDFTLEW